MAEREKRLLSELSMKIKTPEGLQDLEKEPAYIRSVICPSTLCPQVMYPMCPAIHLPTEKAKSQIKSNNSFPCTIM
jgi:hypothetical protein